MKLLSVDWLFICRLRLASLLLAGALLVSACNPIPGVMDDTPTVDVLPQTGATETAEVATQPLPATATVPPVQATLAPTADESDQEVVIAVQSGRFAPDPVSVPVGTTVTWRNRGGGEHTVTADDGSFASGSMDIGATFSYTFTTPGEYPYYCELHGGPGGAGMSGVIEVTP